MTEVVDLPARTGPAPAADQRGIAAGAPILAAVDLGEASRAAVSWASELAERTGAPLQILHVLHDPAEGPGKYARHKSDPLEPMADTAERMLSEFMAEMRAAHPGLKALDAATTKLAKGLPAQTIVNEARALGASLIVIGCRGKSSLAKLLYGSNARRVTRLSPIPVTVVKAPSP
jgi:nucleotide-binding universal stress UspA family protein